MSFDVKSKEMLNEIIRSAQMGNSQSMEELGDYYILASKNDKGTESYGVGIEWYERAAGCNNHLASLKLEELTGEKYIYADYLSHYIVEFLITLICFFVLTNLAIRYSIHFVSIFLILVSCVGFERLMRGIYYDNEFRNDSVLKRYYVWGRGFERFFVIAGASICFVALIIGFVIAIWNWDHNNAFIMVAKTSILVLCFGMTAKSFRNLIKTKWKFSEHKPHVSRIANELGASRLQVELVLFYLGTLACVGVVILSAVVL